MKETTIDMSVSRRSLCNLCAVISLRLVMPCLAYSSFIFGDSLVDAGNNNYIFTLAKADMPPYGIDFTAFNGKPTGRFTNGMTTADILGQALGANSFVLPYLSPATHGKAIIQGVNYASGASGILEETGSLFVGRISLGRQIDNFMKTRDELLKLMGEEDCVQILEKAIFSITTGSNDILNYLLPSLPLITDKTSSADLQDTMVTNMALQLKRLHEMGARKFVVAGVGPLGCIPIIRALNLGSCSSLATDLAQGYNQKLIEMLDELNKEMGPTSIFLYANAYSALNDIIENYQDYGFDNVGEACCEGIICYVGDWKLSTNRTVLCSDRTKYVFWDAYHPTEAANIVISTKFLDGDTSFAVPINIHQLAGMWVTAPSPHIHHQWP